MTKKTRDKIVSELGAGAVIRHVPSLFRAYRVELVDAKGKLIRRLQYATFDQLRSERLIVLAVRGKRSWDPSTYALRAELAQTRC